MKRVHAALAAAGVLLAGTGTMLLTGHSKPVAPAAVAVAARPGPVEQPTMAGGLESDHCTIHGLLPDPYCTPGAFNAHVTDQTIADTVCVRGWSSTIRPPVDYTDQLKVQQIQQYGYTDTSPSSYEEDHLVPLAGGGNPTDPANLWPEPIEAAHQKDKVEDAIHKAICDGSAKLDDARKAMATNWSTALQTLGLPAIPGVPVQSGGNSTAEAQR